MVWCESGNFRNEDVVRNEGGGELQTWPELKITRKLWGDELKNYDDL